jgi:DNA-binding PadR family transcriptional regulator
LYIKAMALSHAILALLIQHPSTGYDLTKAFAGSVGCFWKATHQQIYRELAKLESQGWVRVEVVGQTSRPDKKVYHMTDAGRQALVEWLAQPCDIPGLKDELLVKIFAGELADPTFLCQELERHRQLHQATLSQYEQIQQQFFAEPAHLAPSDRFSYLTLRRGIRYEQEWVAWCEEAIEQLQQEKAM